MQHAPPATVPLADAATLAAWLRAQTAPGCAQTATTLALVYRLDGTPALHGGLLQALTLATAEHSGLQLRHDGTLYRDGEAAGRVTLELTAQNDASLARITAPFADGLARITAPFADGLAQVLTARLADWNARPYLPVLNRWAAFALDGAIDQKGRRISIRDGKPVFSE